VLSASAQPTRRRGGGPLTLSGFFALTGLTVGMLLSRPQVQDPDFWWHVRNGNTMLKTGHLIHVNPYAFMAAGHHWVLQEWLSETWMAAVAAFSGRLGVVVVYWLITLAMYLVIWARAKSIGPANGLTVGLGLLLAAITAFPILGPRSQMETYLLVGVVMLVVDRQLRQGGRSAWILPPVFLVWTNLHAGFVMGMILLAGVLVAEGTCSALGLRGPEQRWRIQQLLWATVCSAAACLVNPNGPVITVYPFQTQFSSAQQALIQEWVSPNFHAITLIPLLVLIATLAWLVVRYRGLALRDGLVLTLAVLVSLQSVRNLVILVVVGTPIWISLAERLRQEIAGRWRPRLRRRQPRLVVLIELCYLAALVVVLAIQVDVQGSPPLDSSTYVQAFPVCAARWLDSAPGHLRIFNQYGDGGFLAYTVPKDKVFIFGDAALMGSTVLYRYSDIIDLSPKWLHSLDSSPSQLVEFERGSAFPDALQREPQWTLVYRDKRVEIWERTSLLSSLHMPQNPSSAYWRSKGVAACSSRAEPYR
jgi:hypothetical protein